MTESSRTPDAPLSRALALSRRALAAGPAGLLTDFDGTLSPIVGDPASARLVAGADGALAELADRLAVVAVVTGRSALDARGMTGVPGLLVAGNHGTEWLEPDATSPSAGAAHESARARIDEVLGRLRELPGVTTEHKGLSATVHYRGAPDPAATRARILHGLGDTDSSGVELRHGRMSVELRPSGLGDKGTAARAIVERFALRGAVVMGDDVTDLDMFRAIAELRDAGRLEGAIIGVGGGDQEVPAAVAEAADALLADPTEAAAFLAALSES